MAVTTIDIYNKEGNLVRVEAHKESGEHIADFLWDDRDEQTSDNRVKFRQWVNHFLKQKGYEVHE